MTNYQRTYSIGEVVVEGSANPPRDRAARAAGPLDDVRLHRPGLGFDTSRDAFVGVHEGLHEARVPFAGRATDSIAHGWNPVGSHEVTLDLAPGESTELAFVLAFVQHATASSRPRAQWTPARAVPCSSASRRPVRWTRRSSCSPPPGGSCSAASR